MPPVFDLEMIRKALPLRTVCEREGLEFRREGTNVKAPCPFHSERSGSFTIHGESPDRAHCYGCGWSGDVFAFWGELRGLDCKDRESFKTVVAQLASLAGIGPRIAGVTFAKKEIPRRKPLSLSESRKPQLPDMRLLREPERQQLATLRGLSRSGIVAAERDFRLGYCAWPRDLDGRECSRSLASWVVTDPERWCAQFRTLSGKPYVGKDGNEFKSYSTKNTSWAVGSAQTGERERIVLVEGGADMLAAYHLLSELQGLYDVAIWCLFGASNNLSPESLAHARGKRVRILADNDPPKERTFKNRPPIAVRPGIEAAAKWTDQLRGAGAASVETYDLSPLGEGIKDLNDLVRSGYADVEIADLFDF